MQYEISELSDYKVESAIIATAIRHPKFLENCDYIDPNYFFSIENGCMYWCIDSLVKKGIYKIDEFNVSMQINSNSAIKRKLESYNMPKLSDQWDLYNEIARDSLEEYEDLCDKLIALAFKRDLARKTKEINQRCFDKNCSLDKLATDIYDILDQAVDNFVVKADLTPIGNKVDDLYESIKSKQKDGKSGIQSKFEVLGSYFSYDIGELVMLEARMKEGKSAFLMNEAIDKAVKGIPTLIVDTEMNDELFFLRMLAHFSGVNQRKIKDGSLDQNEQYKVDRAIESIKKLPLVHDYREGDVDWNDVYATCRMLQRTMGLKFVVFDYLKDDSDDTYNELGKKTDFLKNRIAGGLNLAVLSACQLNRNNQVADSDKIERYMSTAIIWRHKTAKEIKRDGQQCGNCMAQVKLNRIGEQMVDPEYEYIDFLFRGDLMIITEASQHREVNPVF